MAKNSIVVKILGDIKGFTDALRDTETKLGKFSRGVKTGLKAGGLALAGLGGAAVVAAPKIIELGSQLDALGKKSATVFGDSLSDVESWASTVAGSLGMTNTELVGAAASMADLLKPMGFSSDQAAAMSTDMLNLAGALSAWSGGQQSATDVADTLSKAMLGEREQLKALGISISEADVQARLAAKGQKDLTGEALAQAKALATQELILEKSTDAQTAWADGSMDAVKAQNESQASLRRLQEGLIKAVYPALIKVLPVVEKFAVWLGEKLPPIIEGLRAAFERYFPPILATIKGVVDFVRGNWEYITAAFAGVALAIGASLVPAFVAWAASAGAAALATLAAAAPVIAVGAAIAALAAGVVWAYRNVDWFREAVDKVGRFLKSAFKGAVDIAAAAFDGVTTAVRTVWGWVRTLWDRTEGIRSFLAGAFKLAIGAVVFQFELYVAAIRTVWSWIRTLWDRTEGLRSFLAGAFKLAIGVVRDAFELLRNTIESVWGWLQNLWSKASEVVGWFRDRFVAGMDASRQATLGLADALGAVYRWFGMIAPAAELAGRRIAEAAGARLPTGSSTSSPARPRTSAPGGRRIQAFDSGGIVGGPIGSPQLILAHGGETVLPTHKRGGAAMAGQSVNITINAGVGADGFAVGQQIVNAIKVYERANGAGWRAA